jgi:hypothetical protein
MANLNPISSPMQQEEVSPTRIGGERLNQKIGQNINFLLQQARFDVGEIQWSILDETQFAAQYGPNWVLADGRNVSNSAYQFVTGNEFVPDFRGRFLSQVNTESTGFNPNTTLLEIQDSQNENHSHPMFSRGGGDAPPYMRDNTQLISSTTTGIPPNETTTVRSAQMRYTPSSGVPDTGLTRVQGGDELRPANFALYCYIKID